MHQNDIYKAELNRASKHYKQTMNIVICKYKNRNEQKLRDMHSHRPKDVWKILNNFNQASQAKMPDMQNVYLHFQNLNLADNYESKETPDMEANIDYDDKDLNCPINQRVR